MELRNSLIAWLLIASCAPACAQSLTPGQAAGGGAAVAAGAAALLLNGSKDNSVVPVTALANLPPWLGGTGLAPGGPAGVTTASGVATVSGGPGFVFDTIVVGIVMETVSSTTSTSSTN